MRSQTSALNEQQAHAIRELSNLRNFSGPPKEFWPKYLAALAAVASASKAALVVQDAAKGGDWKRLGDWSANIGASKIATTFQSRLETFATDCAKQGQSLLSLLEEGSSRNADHYVIATALPMQRTTQFSVVVLLLSEFSEGAARESLLRVNLGTDVPESYRQRQASEQASVTVQKLATALDLMVSVNAEKRFLATALAFCNGLSTTFRCQRVSLGWFEGGYIRLRAISRTEKFDPKMQAVRALEAAMDEALDQDEEVVWPAPEGSAVSTRDHDKFAAEHKPGHVCSVPLRSEGKPVAAITCERLESPFTATEVDQLRLCCDQAVRRLADLHHSDRWFGARLWARSKEKAALLVGPKHTTAKIASFLILVALIALFFVKVPYRVEGTFVVKSDNVSFRTAPFDGYIEQVFVRPGDTVKAGAPLLKLVTRELELEELGASADLSRYRREAERGRATNDFAGMRVAMSLAEQSQARLDLVKLRLGEATLKAPFDGVVIEGDLRDRLAAPVKQGDTLFRIARLENLYLEAEIPERDVHEVLARQTGEISFVSQPKLKFPVRVEKLEPAAFPRQEGNVFLLRCSFVDGVQPWWRPGMSGLCKINIEPRTLWWIVTHRTVDFLRLKLWW
jgi:multidrug resistance efflux pump